MAQGPEFTDSSRKDALDVEAIRNIHGLFNSNFESFDKKMNEVLQYGLDHMGLSAGFIAQTTDDRLKTIYTQGGPFPEAMHDCPIDDSYCQYTIDSEVSFTVTGKEHEKYSDIAASKSGIHTYIGSKIYVDNDVYGTVCFFDMNDDIVFDESDKVFVEFLARFIGQDIQTQLDQQELAQQRDQFRDFANLVSHDLKNPLSCALGYMDLIKNSESPKEEHIEAVDSSLQVMDSIISNMELLAKTMNRVEDLEEINLGRFFRNHNENISGDHEDVNLEIKEDLNDTVILANEGLFSRVVSNIVTNCIDHNDISVQITIGSTDTGFFIEDDGAGIPEDKRDHIFEKGYTSSSDGTGYGLFIVKRICDVHDWDIHITESASGGARFEFETY